MSATAMVAHIARTCQCQCVFCGQNPDEVPWADFAAADPSRPVNNICYECGDTCSKRWPCLTRAQAEQKAKDDSTFQGQVIHLTRIKLGEAAKIFLPQSLIQDEEIGI